MSLENVNYEYDMGLSDSGIAVWHVIEGSTDNDAKFNCMTNFAWNAGAGNDNPRQGIRLLRPSVNYYDVRALWNNEEDDLNNFGLVCPNDGDAHNAILCAEGSPSFSLSDFSSSGPIMSFFVTIPRI